MALLGAHVSVAGGVQNAPERGRAIAADAIQIFSANQNRWHSPPLTEDNILILSNGDHRCRICKRAYDHAWRSRAKWLPLRLCL